MTPYYHLWTEKLYNLYIPGKAVSMVRPNFRLDCEYQASSDDYMKKWAPIFGDPRTVSFLTLKTATIWVEEQEKAKEWMKQMTMPVLFLEAELDDTVDNKAIKEYSELCPNPDNEYRVIKGCDHSLVAFEPSYAT